MIFFPTGSGDVVNARWVREHACFTHERGSRDVRSREAGFQARMSCQKCRQSYVLVWIDQPVTAAFAHAQQIGNRDRSVIERERKRRAVKIASRNHLATF